MVISLILHFPFCIRDTSLHFAFLLCFLGFDFLMPDLSSSSLFFEAMRALPASSPPFDYGQAGAVLVNLRRSMKASLFFSLLPFCEHLFDLVQSPSRFPKKMVERFWTVGSTLTLLLRTVFPRFLTSRHVLVLTFFAFLWPHLRFCSVLELCFPLTLIRPSWEGLSRSGTVDFSIAGPWGNLPGRFVTKSKFRPSYLPLFRPPQRTPLPPVQNETL